jgi:hypothetical protein
MSNELQTTSTTANNLADLKELFGPPPVLSSEDSNAYDAVMVRFVESIKPKDFIEQMFIKDLTDLTWEIKRYSRHKALLIKRQCDALFEDVEQDEDAEQDQQTEKEQTEQDEQTQQADSPTQYERKLELEEAFDSAVPDVDEIVTSTPEELLQAAALESGINYYERLDRLIGVAMARRKDVLEQIDLYRVGLGERLRRVSDEIIDAEFSEAELPSLAPADAAQ